MSNGGRRVDGGYDILRRCFCGGAASIHTSRATTNPIRKFFTCQMSKVSKYVLLRCICSICCDVCGSSNMFYVYDGGCHMEMVRRDNYGGTHYHKAENSRAY